MKDRFFLIGLIVGIGGILLGNSLEGGHFSSLLQFTAFVIVVSGTLGAVFVTHPLSEVKASVSLLKRAVRKTSESQRQKISTEIISAAELVKKESPLQLEKKLNGFSDPFMKDVFRMIVDGVPPEIIEEVFSSEIDVMESKLLRKAKVWTDAGGFAPTIGILGAVLGLIHVMSNLSDTSQLGQGIAIAFVATIYGVASANLIFLPIGNKIKYEIENIVQNKLMILEAGVFIAKNHPITVIKQQALSYNNEIEL